MEHELLTCMCESSEHIAIINMDDDGFVSLSVFLCKLPFWQRVLNGLKYIFGYKSKFGDFDEIILTKEDGKKLQKITDILKKQKN